MSLRILYQDPFLIAINKPAGFYVHPPEDFAYRIPNEFNCLYLLRKQVNEYLYPVHRLDRATSGVLLFALNPSSAKALCDLFQQRKVKKTYFCVTRGWTEEVGVIDYPLEGVDSLTAFQQVARLETPHPIGRYSSSRYSILRVEPHSGRRHQIRKHLRHISHPLIGDTAYGDSAHNRLFREKWDIGRLLLKAYSIEVDHPETGLPLRITSRWDGLWHRVFDLFGVCPLEPR